MMFLMFLPASRMVVLLGTGVSRVHEPRHNWCEKTAGCSVLLSIRSLLLKLLVAKQQVSAAQMFSLWGPWTRERVCRLKSRPVICHSCNADWSQTRSIVLKKVQCLVILFCLKLIYVIIMGFMLWVIVL